MADQVFPDTEVGDAPCPICGASLCAEIFDEHLDLCRQQNMEPTAPVVCPFNAAHVIPMSELGVHLAYCPDRYYFLSDQEHEFYPADGEPADDAIAPEIDQGILSQYSSNSFPPPLEASVDISMLLNEIGGSGTG